MPQRSVVCFNHEIGLQKSLFNYVNTVQMWHCMQHSKLKLFHLSYIIRILAESDVSNKNHFLKNGRIQQWIIRWCSKRRHNFADAWSVEAVTRHSAAAASNSSVILAQAPRLSVANWASAPTEHPPSPLHFRRMAPVPVAKAGHLWWRRMVAAASATSASDRWRHYGRRATFAGLMCL